ncbi:hypothetical protein BCR44DRAFT_164720 [Catenaria anguillulae PL171]|uniref:Uncharacterized protein n=1 Tax=Catenaria anguillulae PL171 TaxID=765915 RepID=A0A1Y2HNJ8_9FUNG|nr:hypothetical protein BCR44DRAFT_164720 [Catenaria anguillulae PL171]
MDDCIVSKGGRLTPLTPGRTPAVLTTILTCSTPANVTHCNLTTNRQHAHSHRQPPFLLLCHVLTPPLARDTLASVIRPGASANVAPATATNAMHAKRHQVARPWFKAGFVPPTRVSHGDRCLRGQPTHASLVGPDIRAVHRRVDCETCQNLSDLAFRPSCDIALGMQPDRDYLAPHQRHHRTSNGLLHQPSCCQPSESHLARGSQSPWYYRRLCDRLDPGPFISMDGKYCLRTDTSKLSTIKRSACSIGTSAHPRHSCVRPLWTTTSTNRTAAQTPCWGRSTRLRNGRRV